MITPTINSLADLDQFRNPEWGPVPAAQGQNIRILSASHDRVHEANLALLNSCRISVAGAMYGFTDTEAAKVVKRLLLDPKIHNQWTFDQSQYMGPTEHKMFEELGLLESNSVATGTSLHGKIIHDKTMVIDGRFVVTGSTNWSLQGEQLQENQYVVIDDYPLAVQVTRDLNLVHTKCLTQMAKAAAR